MSCGCEDTKDFCVEAGATFAPIIRWGLKTLTSVAITAIAQSTPALITAPAHGCPAGWPAAVVDCTGMFEINASRYPPVRANLHEVTVVSPDQVAFNDVTSALFQPYVSGGALVFNTPVPLEGVSATMTFWDDPEHDDTPLLTLTTGSGITLDAVNFQILPFLQTVGLAWTQAYYSLQATDGSGVVTTLLEGILTINP